MCALGNRTFRAVQNRKPVPNQLVSLPTVPNRQSGRLLLRMPLFALPFVCIGYAASFCVHSGRQTWSLTADRPSAAAAVLSSAHVSIMDLSAMKSYITGNPVQAAVVGLVAVLTSPVLLVAGWPLVQFLLVQLAPVLLPALLLAVVSASTDARRSHHRFLDSDPGAPAQAEASHNHCCCCCCRRHPSYHPAGWGVLPVKAGPTGRQLR